MVRRGGLVDLARATVYFVRWWRGEVGSMETDHQIPTTGTQAWGFDFQWDLPPQEIGVGKEEYARIVQAQMEQCIEDYEVTTDLEEAGENNLSETQIRKRAVVEIKEKRRLKNLSKR